MNVGQVANVTQLPIRTLHYYEAISLVVPKRRPNGYREYDGASIQKLNFIRRARNLGFSVDVCRTLLSLYEDRSRASSDVRAIARKHLEEIDTKIDELQSLQGTLQHLIDNCKGNSRPDCPIIDELSGREEISASDKI